jgi:hypothetical protein
MVSLYRTVVDEHRRAVRDVELEQRIAAGYLEDVGAKAQRTGRD